MWVLVEIPLCVLGGVAQIIEQFLFILVHLYDVHVYSPLQSSLSPMVAKVPRYITCFGRQWEVFNANIISCARTFLVIPIAWCLKYEFYWYSFLLVLFHDFLDHVDGIVAKVQRSIYGNIDDPLLGGFMDAFCDKIVNVTSLWTILLLTNFTPMGDQACMLYIMSCAIIISYEFVLGVVRVQDYFRAYYERLHKIKKSGPSTVGSTSAIMEGKLKEKLESLGIAFLCLAQSNENAFYSLSGMTGVLCLLLSIRLAHASLQQKLRARSTSGVVKIPEVVANSTNNLLEDKEDQFDNENLEDEDNMGKPYDAEEDNKQFEKFHSMLIRQQSVPCLNVDVRVDRVYSVGCFDLFHSGHVRLLQRMKSIGKQLVIGVHDSRSIFKLKKRVPIDSTEKRMMNVKQFADVVYCVAGTDPTTFLKCIVATDDGCSNMYVRGDDMKQFPAREMCESIMPVKFLPYSKDVSSTKLRNNKFDHASMFGPHVRGDGHGDVLY